MLTPAGALPSPPPGPGRLRSPAPHLRRPARCPPARAPRGTRLGPAPLPCGTRARPRFALAFARPTEPWRSAAPAASSRCSSAVMAETPLRGSPASRRRRWPSLAGGGGGGGEEEVKEEAPPPPSTPLEPHLRPAARQRLSPTRLPPACARTQQGAAAGRASRSARLRTPGSDPRAGHVTSAPPAPNGQLVRRSGGLRPRKWCCRAGDPVFPSLFLRRRPLKPPPHFSDSPPAQDSLQTS